MEIIGVINSFVVKKSKNHKKKIIVQINDSINSKNNPIIEFRNKLFETANSFREGDFVKVNFYADGRFDAYGNYYNNQIAQSIIRI